jgi:hypothetical protein
MEMINDRNAENPSAPITIKNGAAVTFDTEPAPPFIVRPNKVLDDPTLSTEQKRSILASWLSDKHAVPDAPRWRQLENGAFVDTQDIWKALYALDDAEMDRRNVQSRASPPSEPRGKQRLKWLSALDMRKHDDDDDDPPPSPAAIQLPFRNNAGSTFDLGPAILRAA